MLRRDVVEACRQNRFAVYAVDTIGEALELMTGVPAGEWSDEGYPEGTLLAQAVKKADEYWRRTLASPEHLTSVRPGATDEEPAPPAKKSRRGRGGSDASETAGRDQPRP
jgi:hypothetical protein